MDRAEMREKIEAAIDECRYGDSVAGGYRYDGDKLRDRLMTLFEPLVGVAEKAQQLGLHLTDLRLHRLTYPGCAALSALEQALASLDV